MGPLQGMLPLTVQLPCLACSFISLQSFSLREARCLRFPSFISLALLQLASLFLALGSSMEALFGVLFLNGLVPLFVSFLVFIIPFFYMACRLSVGVPAALLENLGPREALERSYALTKDNAGRAFLIYLLYFAILYAAMNYSPIPFGIGTFSKRSWHAAEPGRRMAQSESRPLSWRRVLITPILTIAIAFFYFDLRVRKEAFDLQMMMMNPLAGGVPAPRNTATLLS